MVSSVVCVSVIYENLSTICAFTHVNNEQLGAEIQTIVQERKYFLRFVFNFI